MIHSPLFRAAAAAALLGATAQVSAGVVYASNSNSLYTLNKVDGSATLVGTMLTAASGRAVIDMTAVGTTLYGLVQQQVGNVVQTNLAVIDAATATLTDLPLINGIVTNSGPARRIDAIAYDAASGRMYGVNNGPDRSLYTLDLVTGAATRIGALPSVSDPNIQYRSLGFGAGGALFAALITAGSNSASQLVRLDPATAAQTLVGSTLADTIADLAYDADDGVFYGGGSRTEASTGNTVTAFLSINTLTGAATELSSGFAGGWNGLAVVPAAVPEPGTLLLAALAITGLLAGQRRKPMAP
ncbi:PEP-CTERM sorting domain-containing protein [Rubrivivax rivuli]|uniref:PEP-CTERM sorting domain-containing protein n=1 Tax=Rubrivivax rivuli TaxID=1862385 RepID=A0A437RRV9_9BURK|nr:PEP-CTERM sorting domain-containing protein [Rubrivivax rivuli]RVU49520.1 PEP-CTERM sorting domain-containing protein [Rubrivivax rivuli]